MTKTTPTYGWPYPEPSDARGAGANAIRDLALAQEFTVAQLGAELDTAATNLWATGANDATQVALANNAWTPVGYETIGADGFSYAAGVFTYEGATSRWFVVSFGENLAVSGSQPSAGLRVLHNGAVTHQLHHGDNYAHLGGATVLRLDPGNTLQLADWANDGTGSLGGARDRAWLRAVSI